MRCCSVAMAEPAAPTVMATAQSSAEILLEKDMGAKSKGKRVVCKPSLLSWECVLQWVCFVTN